MLTRLKKATGGLPRTFWYLWWGNLINRSGAFVTIALTFYLNNERGFDPSLVGLILGLIGAGGAVGSLLGGQLADRWGRRSCLLLSQVLTAAMLLLLSAGRQPWLLGATALLLGISQSMARPAFAAMMVDIVPEADRKRAFSLNFWANNLAFTVAALLGGYAAEHNYTVVFAADAATTLAMACIIFLRAPESRPDTRRLDRAAKADQNPFRDRAFLTLCLMSFLGTLIFLQYQSSLPLDMNDKGLSAQTYGIVMSVNAVMIVLGQLFIADLTDTWDTTRTLAVTYVIVGVGFGLTAFADNVWLYVLSVSVWTVGEMLQSPGMSATLAELSPATARARYQSVFSLSIMAASFLAPTAGGFVIDSLGSDALWAGCLVLGVLTALLTLASGPARERRAEELRQRATTATDETASTSDTA